MKTYSELIKFSTLKERFKYLQIGGKVGEDTFGGRRMLNQNFYKSVEWKQFRRRIIARDNGLELGMDGWEIHGSIYIHHIVPLTEYDLLNRTNLLMDEDNVISCSFTMHQAIHYGDESVIPEDWKPRAPNDTIPWR